MSKFKVGDWVKVKATQEVLGKYHCKDIKSGGIYEILGLGSGEVYLGVGDEDYLDRLPHYVIPKMIEPLPKENPYIGTYSGKKFHFLNPSPEEICIEDIANALSMNCRFNGHVNKFYSIAEHSVIMAIIMFREGYSAEECLATLLHDASEAYICDIPRPIKPHLNNYLKLEGNIEKAIQKKYGVGEMNERGKYLDFHICGEEARQLFNHVPEWVEEFERIPEVEELHLGMSPQEAKVSFSTWFEILNKLL